MRNRIIENNFIFESKTQAAIIFLSFLIGIATFMSLYQFVNQKYAHDSDIQIKRQTLLKNLYTASPALITGGRNIAFETGNGITTAPASYITMLDCCESDEAIADRIAIGQTKCNIIKHKMKLPAISYKD
jgi:hypothetical protein